MKVIGGPLDGQTYRWTTARFVVIPDAADTLTVYMPEWNHTVTLFGEHTYEVKCYARGRRRQYRLEHVGYRKPTLPAGAVRVPQWNEWVA